MCKKKFIKNSPLYLLTLANIAYALKNGFVWVTWFAVALSLLVLILDIMENTKGRI